MKNRSGEVIESISFDQCVALVGCPYWLCRAAVGQKCLEKGGKARLDYPHRSRAILALDTQRKQKAEKGNQS